MMINPPKPPEGPKPTKALFNSLYQDVKAPISVENQTVFQSDTGGKKQKMSEDQARMKLNLSSNTNETDIIQRGGMKSVNFVANI
jgi:hypothetical protein